MEDEKNLETQEVEEIEGFEGIDPEIVKQVIEENKEESEPETESEPEQESEQSELEKLRGELNLYRNRYGDINQAQQVQQQQQMQTPPIPEQKITPEISDTIEKYTRLKAKQMTGWSDDDIDALEYMDDDDPRRAQWATALNLSRNEIYDQIRRTRAQISMNQQRFMMEHRAALNAFNEYANREMRDPNFAKVRDYAIGDYMKRHSASDQFTLASAYNRIQRNMASPSDYMLVRNFFENAKQSLNLQPQQTQFPRSSRVGGVAGSANRRLSEREIEAMLDRGEWDSIPQEYRDQMMNAYIPMHG